MSEKKDDKVHKARPIKLPPAPPKDGPKCPKCKKAGTLKERYTGEPVSSEKYLCSTPGCDQGLYSVFNMPKT